MIKVEQLDKFNDSKQKLDCIKYIKGFYEIGLKECKDLVDTHWDNSNFGIQIFDRLLHNYNLIGENDSNKEDNLFKEKLIRKLKLRNSRLILIEKEWLIKYLEDDIRSTKK